MHRVLYVQPAYSQLLLAHCSRVRQIWAELSAMESPDRKRLPLDALFSSCCASRIASKPPVVSCNSTSDVNGNQNEIGNKRLLGYRSAHRARQAK